MKIYFSSFYIYIYIYIYTRTQLLSFSKIYTITHIFNFYHVTQKLTGDQENFVFLFFSVCVWIDFQMFLLFRNA